MRTIAAVAITLLAGAANAQDVSSGSPQAAPKPATELARLKSLEGTWKCNGVAPAGATGPGSPETKYVSTFAVKRAWDGFAYTITYDQKHSKPHFTGAWNVGWDGNQKKFLLFWLDNVGNVGLETTSDWEGNVLIAQGEGFGPAGPSTFKDTFTRKGPHSLHWKGELQPHSTNAWITIGEDECVKQ